MIKKISQKHYPYSLVILLSLALFYWLMTRNDTVYSATVPVISTLSVISEGSLTPVRIAADTQGNLYVTDPRSGGVLKYNSAGNLLQKITTSSTSMLGIAVTRTNEILVSQGSTVAVYSVSGVNTRVFGTFGMANGIALDDSGAIYVVDSKNNRIQVFNPDYTLKNTFGSAGTGSGQFRQPTGITYEKKSAQLAVVDTLNGRVQFFTPGGEFVKAVGSLGVGPLKFTSPQAVTFEYSPDGTLNRLYVLDSFQANIQVIDAVSLSFLRYIGSYGTHGGQMVTPGDILFDSFGRLIIPNGTGNLTLFGVEGTSPPVTTGGTAPVFTVPPVGNSPPTLNVKPLVAVTKSAAITVSGTVTGGATVTVNGSMATVAPDGGWSATIQLTQQGLNNIAVTATLNGSSSSANAYITLDSTPPVVEALVFPQPGTITGNPVLPVYGAVVDTTATTVTVTVNNISQTLAVDNGLFNGAIVLQSGANIITISATDAAGLVSKPFAGQITYNPLAPEVALSTPSGAVTNNASYTVTGTAAVNSQITVNGVSATVSGNRWQASIPLKPGLNPITVTATAGNSQIVSMLSSSVTYAPEQPQLAITFPPADSATATDTFTISGVAGKGTLVTAAMGSTQLPVTVSANGTFTAAMSEFAVPGSYPVTISAVDANGKMSTVTRTIIYDPLVPVLSSIDATPLAIKVSSIGRVVIAKDKNGLIVTPNNSNGTSSLDLTGASYDPASLNIYALSPAGVSSRNGDLNGDGVVDIADALLAMQISLGIAPPVGFEQLLRGDVAPLVNHVPTPDGRIRLDDAIMILQKVIGMPW